MFDPRRESEELRSEMALRDALRRLPAPDVSPDFDARILAALRRRRFPTWEPLFDFLRPALPAATASVVGTVVMLGLVAWTTRAPLPRMAKSPPVSGLIVPLRDINDILDEAVAHPNRPPYALWAAPLAEKPRRSALPSRRSLAPLPKV